MTAATAESGGSGGQLDGCRGTCGPGRGSPQRLLRSWSPACLPSLPCSCDGKKQGRCSKSAPLHGMPAGRATVERALLRQPPLSSVPSALSILAHMLLPAVSRLVSCRSDLDFLPANSFPSIFCYRTRAHRPPGDTAEISGGDAALSAPDKPECGPSVDGGSLVAPSGPRYLPQNCRVQGMAPPP